MTEFHDQANDLNKTVKDKALDPKTKVKILGSIGSSLSELHIGFAKAGNEKMAIGATIGANLANLAASLETFSALSKAGSLMKFTSALSLLSGGLTLMTSLMDGGGGGMGEALGAIGELLMEGFETVIKEIRTLGLQMHYRFDRLEEMMDSQGFRLELGIMEQIHQGKRLDLILRETHETSLRKSIEIEDRLRRLGESFSSSFSLVTSSMSAFRHEGLYKVISQILYHQEAGLLVDKPEKVHEFIGELYGLWLTVGKSPHVTGFALVGSAKPSEILARLTDDPSNLIGYVTGKKVCHPTILQVVTTYLQGLMVLVDPNPFHERILEGLDVSRLEMKEALSSPSLAHLPSLLCHVEPADLADRRERSERKALHHRRLLIDESMGHLRTVMGHANFVTLTKELGNMLQGKASLFKGSQLSPCRAGFNLVRRTYVDRHHKWVFPHNYDTSWKRENSRGTFCGGGVAPGNHMCKPGQWMYRLDGPYQEDGLEEDVVSSFVERVTDPSFYQEDLVEKLEAWFEGFDSSQPYLMATLTHEGQVMNVPVKLDSEQNERIQNLMVHGFLPRLHVEIRKDTLKVAMEICDLDETDPHMTSTFTKTITLPHSFHTTSTLSPTDILLWFLLGGFSLKTFGYYWRRTDSWDLRSAGPRSLCTYTLGILPTSEGLTSVKDEGIPLLTPDLVTHHISKKIDGWRKSFERSIEGEEAETIRLIHAKVDEHLEILRSD